jgi:hypothetical protein
VNRKERTFKAQVMSGHKEDALGHPGKAFYGAAGAVI